MPAVLPATATAPVASSSQHAPLATRPSQNAPPQRQFARRMTSDDVMAPPLSAGIASYAPSDHSVSEIDTTRYPPARRPSWIQRFSTISMSSSRPTSPAPLSPAVSCSNGSMAFSQDGSTAPVFGRPSTSSTSRNRLVKRSSSVRAPGQAPPQGAATLRPSFRRPATSHQRAAALYAHQARNDDARSQRTVDESATRESVYSPSPSPDCQFEYTQYFTAKITRERTVTKKKGSTTLRGSFKRILPDDKHLPTLVLARSVTAATPELDDSSSDDSDSIFSVSRPETPFSIAAFATKESTHTGSRPSTDEADDATRTKRFSFTDFLSLSKKHLTAAGASRPTLSRRASQRVYSAPVLRTMNRRPHSTSYGEADRHVTEPALAAARRAIATSAGPTDVGSAHNGLQGGSWATPSPTLAARRVSAGTLPVEGLASMPQHLEGPSAALGANQAPPSPTLAQSGVRVSRHSMAPSEQASTLVGSSDNELRGLGFGDDDDADVHSETCFDSLRTGATRSTSGGARGPRIETIFDESPPSKVKVTALRDLLPPGSLGDHTIHGAAGHQSIAEEEENTTTPVRTVRPDRSSQESPSCGRTRGAPLFSNTVSSTSSSMPKPLSLGTLEWDSRPGNNDDDDDSSRWSLEEADPEDPWIDPPTTNHSTSTVSHFALNAHRLPPGLASKPTTPHHLTTEFGDRDTRSSIFDWSEQQLADKNSGNCTPPRPRTVHGKKDADRRGSRSVGRRVSSGLHARSQSVPVVPDLTGKRNTVVTNKFGTWGVGSKGVTEDWNDDFDFTELNGETIEEGDASPRVDSGTSMVVPKSIQEQQNNVLANIGLLREWGLLIEELKEHRTRAVALGIIDGPHSSTWEEVDAMIDLADQEAGHQDVAHVTPPSTPGFDDDGFEEPTPSPSHGRGRNKSETPEQEVRKSPMPSPHPRKSILPPNDDIFAPQSSPAPPQSLFDTNHVNHDIKAALTRPRKDSEAKARSVIEALQKRRSVHEPLLDTPPTPSSKKVPFDTATLRRIVPYVSSLTRKVKETIRDAEGLYSSPLASPMNEETQRDKMFQADADLAAQMKLMTVM
ncbi:hypothetical protein yc1106_01787 [Curvularia clavata]|uniref:Uncharacterized protein n=1 Tax=Curvularia clavata TaxID=95742 RepID=A0A9Q9DNY0_CURCL|nr:hypothetical protein yc1106_01787 [Curvularia clavata]